MYQVYAEDYTTLSQKLRNPTSNFQQLNFAKDPNGCNTLKTKQKTEATYNPEKQCVPLSPFVFQQTIQSKMEQLFLCYKSLSK